MGATARAVSASAGAASPTGWTSSRMQVAAARPGSITAARRAPWSRTRRSTCR